MTRPANDRWRLTGLPAGRRTKFLVLAFWLVLVTMAAPLAIRLTELQSNESLMVLPRGAEANAAIERCGRSSRYADEAGEMPDRAIPNRSEEVLKAALQGSS
jgi:hypothetical protein